MQAGRGAARPPIGIALEGDLGRRIDAVMAVAMLNGLTVRSESRSIALSISRTNLKTARLADVVSGFYSPRPVGGSAMIGMPEGGAPSDTDPPLTTILSRTTAEGTPAYESNIATVLDTADNAVLIRNMLLAQHDGNAAIVLAGPATGLARVMQLFGARPQIEAKVARLVVAGGNFGGGGADPSMAADVAAARALLADWPSELVVVGAEVGAALPFPAATVELDMAWAPAHPVADAYRAFRPMPYDAPSMALAATLYAVHPDEGYFALSEPGTVTVGADGTTTFAPGAGGRHRYLMADPAQKDRVITMFTELVSARPAPRPGRRGARPVPPEPQPPKPVPSVDPSAGRPPAP